MMSEKSSVSVAMDNDSGVNQEVHKIYGQILDNSDTELSKDDLNEGSSEKEDEGIGTLNTFTIPMTWSDSILNDGNQLNNPLPNVSYFLK